MRGKDKLGADFLLLAMRMNKDLPFTRPSNSDLDEQAHYEDTRQLIGWAIFLVEL